MTVIVGWIFSACKKDGSSREDPIISPVSNLKAEATDNPNELSVSWNNPSQAVSIDISYLLEGQSDVNAISKNVPVSGQTGRYLIQVTDYGKYIIAAVAIADNGKRSNKVSIIATPKNNDDYGLENFPEAADPKTVGTKLAQRYIQTISDPAHSVRSNYPYVCTWLGALWFAQAVKNESLYNTLRTKYDNIFFSAGSSSLYPSPDHVDKNIFGAVPLELYKKVKDNKYLNLGLAYADKQWDLPANATQVQKEWHYQGYSWQTRIWIDDMFMITAVQAQAYQVTGNRIYIDRAAKEMAMYLDKIQRPNGLFYHTPTVPYYWGRGNGWMAVGMAELLRLLPEDNMHRKKIEDAYKLMMSTLLQYQTDDGMWRQLIDKSELWKETSGTAMFTYAMIVGVKKGWLDKKTYGAAARKAWISLLTYINSDNNIKDVCEGTNAQNNYQYYVDRKRNTGDLHGQAPMLWCAYALCSDSDNL